MPSLYNACQISDLAIVDIN